MEIHQLQYFIAVAETGGFGRAAKRCNVSQPSLSQQIIKLEGELGEKLFDRLGRSIALTETGHVLLPKAKRILAEVQGIRNDVHNEIEEGIGHLAIGIIPTIAPFILPETLKVFKLNFPNATLSIIESLTDDLIEKLVDAEIDLGIMSLPVRHKLITTETLADEPLLVIAPEHMDFNGVISLAASDLNGIPFIALDEVNCLGEQVEALLLQAHGFAGNCLQNTAALHGKTLR